jgi:hypothetical protein
VVDVDTDDALGCAEAAQQGGGGVRPDVADRDLVIGALHEVGDGGRSHLARSAQDEDPAHAAVLTRRRSRRRTRGSLSARTLHLVGRVVDVDDLDRETRSAKPIGSTTDSRRRQSAG